MLLGEAQAYCAQVYCEYKHRSKVLDPDLVNSFAELLTRKIAEVKIQEARAIYFQELSKDPDFYRSYIDNISIQFLDMSDFTNIKSDRDKLAKQIIQLLFGVNHAK